MWAYAYEVLNETLVPDALFDAECRRVDLSVCTENPLMDAWFIKNFDPSTGVWVHHHPNKKRLHEIATNIMKNRGQRVSGV